MKLNAQEAEDLIIRLTRLALVRPKADELIADADWLEQRTLDAVDAINSAGSPDDEESAGKEFASGFCQDLITQHPAHVRPGFSIEALDVEEADDEG